MPALTTRGASMAMSPSASTVPPRLTTSAACMSTSPAALIRPPELDTSAAALERQNISRQVRS